MRDFARFLGAVFGNWVGKMCGSFGLLSTVIGLSIPILLPPILKRYGIENPDDWAMWAPAIGFGVVGFFGMMFAFFHAWRNEWRKGCELQGQLDERERRKQVRIELGRFLERGTALLARCRDEKQPTPETESNQWSVDVEGFLGGQLDESFVHRFRSSAGLPPVTTSIESPAHLNLWRLLHARQVRLEQFLAELASNHQ